MADAKITDLTAYTTPIDTDVIAIVDVTTDVTKKITKANLTSDKAPLASPVFTTQITTPLVVGGTSTTQDLTLQTTSGVGTTGADMHFLVGNNGGTEAMTILNDGKVGIGTNAPSEKLDVNGKVALNGTVTLYRPTGLTGTLIVGNGGTNLVNTTGTNGFYNLFIGDNAGQDATITTDSVGLGYNALANVTSGIKNMAIGANALLNVTTGYQNIAIGESALRVGTTGIFFNTAIGASAMYNTTVGYNTAIGNNSMYDNTTGTSNTAIGASTLSQKITGSGNTAIGYIAGYRITDASALTISNNSIFIGNDTRALANSSSNEIVIGYNAVGNGSNTATIGNTSLLRTYLTGVNLKAGSATAGTAPLKFTSGTLLTTAEAGAVEFLTDAFYGTITTGAARKTFAFLEAPVFTTSIQTPTIELGNATDTTISRVSAGVIAVEGVNVVLKNLLMYSNLNGAEGFMLNGKIVPSVASNNLTVAIKGMDGNDPSASNPVYVRIGDTIRSITSALSVTKNAGTNWFNAGATSHATYEMDYFVYIGYNATDGVLIGFSRIPYAEIYSDFSTTTTNEKYCAISTITTAAAGDNYVVIGRFPATLSAGAGYTWTVPTFTNKNLIQRPIHETRWMSYLPTYSADSPMTFTSVNSTTTKYKFIGKRLDLMMNFNGTTGGSATETLRFTFPFTAAQAFGIAIDTYDGAHRAGQSLSGTTDTGIQKYDQSVWGLGASKYISGNFFYEPA